MTERALPTEPRLFLPGRKALLFIAGAVLLALGAALYLRYGIIQNTPIGLACEAGEASLTCDVRLAVILLFIRSVFGWTALIAAAVNLVRPNAVVFGIGLVAAAMGLVLYNTRLSALAVPLLLLSLARAAPERS
ncbi:MAG TPA: hypothetical protein VEX16_00820 [Methyloceanibacter sp.]|nr:hypothetical protein [Methyloceanibacter sp.]